jgi:hypothetical protein
VKHFCREKHGVPRGTEKLILTFGEKSSELILGENIKP